MTDLWPEQLSDNTVRAPVSILREQAIFLGSRTKNLVQAEVEPGSNVDGNFTYHFYLVAPTLNNYHYRLFSVEHGITLYPTLLQIGEELGQELGAKPLAREPSNYLDQLRFQQEETWVKSGFLSKPDTQYYLLAQTEDEFLKTLKIILSSTLSRRVVASLLSQIEVSIEGIS